MKGRKFEDELRYLRRNLVLYLVYRSYGVAGSWPLVQGTGVLLIDLTDIL